MLLVYRAVDRREIFDVIITIEIGIGEGRSYWYDMSSVSATLKTHSHADNLSLILPTVIWCYGGYQSTPGLSPSRMGRGGYATKAYNSILLSSRVFNFRGMCEILLIFDHK